MKAIGRVPARSVAIFCLALSLLPVTQAIAQAGGAWTVQEDVLRQPFPYQARDTEIEVVVQEMRQRTGVPVIASEGLSGRVSLTNPDGRLRDALDALAVQGNAVWWFDGGAVHVEPASGLESRLIALEGFDADDLRREMRDTGLEDGQFPLHAGTDTIRVIGPRGYAQAVADLAAHMTAARKAAVRPQGGLPRIIRGRQTN